MRNGNLADYVDGLDPGRDPPNLHSKFNDSHRDELIELIKEFCRDLHTRLTLFARDGPSAIDVFNADADLQSKHIGQEVHTYLREFLITPVVELLGYEFLTEARPAQTEPWIWSDEIYPDLRLLPREWPTGEAVPTIIMEHKKFGRHKYASKELREDYLSKARRPVYGIATDVCTWSVYQVSDNGESEKLSQVPIRRPLQQIRQSVLHEESEFEPESRSKKLDQFLELFELLPGNI